MRTLGIIAVFISTAIIANNKYREYSYFHGDIRSWGFHTFGPPFSDFEIIVLASLAGGILLTLFGKKSTPKP
jgi:hypothetical protein